MNDTKHIWRIFLLVLVGIGAFLVGRILLVPKTFGMFGHYRAANVAEQRAFEVKHQGPESCEPCHADEFALWGASPHKTIICEDCHAPYVTHVKDDNKIADMEKNPAPDFCLRCHQRLPARPADFPQVEALEHLAKLKVEMGDTVCIVCHNPHSPVAKDAAADKNQPVKESKSP